MSFNLNQTYKAKIARHAKIPVDQFDFWFLKAMRKLSGVDKVDPVKHAPLIAQCIKQMARANRLKHTT